MKSNLLLDETQAFALRISSSKKSNKHATKLRLNLHDSLRLLFFPLHFKIAQDSFFNEATTTKVPLTIQMDVMACFYFLLLFLRCLFRNKKKNSRHNRKIFFKEERQKKQRREKIVAEFKDWNVLLLPHLIAYADGFYRSRTFRSPSST